MMAGDHDLDVTAATRHDYLSGAGVGQTAPGHARPVVRGGAGARSLARPLARLIVPLSTPDSPLQQQLLLPLVVQSSAVLFPGHRIPLRLHQSLLPSPTSPETTALVVVVNRCAAPVQSPAADGICVVGCIAEATPAGDGGGDDAGPYRGAILRGLQRALVRLPCEEGPGRRHRAVAHDRPLGVVVAVNPLPEDALAFGAPPAAAARAARGPPSPYASGCAAWPAWATRPFDAPRLAAAARARAEALVPAAAGFRGAPAELSYFLAHNLPLDAARRQRLLECPGGAARLRTLVRWLDELQAVAATEGAEVAEETEAEEPDADADVGGDPERLAEETERRQRPTPRPPPRPSLLSCARCGRPVADASRAMRCTEEGVAGAFVNPHGCVHDIIAVRCLLGEEGEEGEEEEASAGATSGASAAATTTINATTINAASVLYDGPPETQDSWFPGYSWQICCCACFAHLGWRFRRVDLAAPSAGVREFWGLRRDACSLAGVGARGRAAAAAAHGSGGGRGTRGRNVPT